MRTDDLDFFLPPELIAQTPSPVRSASRLLHFRKSDQSISHRVFSDFPGLLRGGDLLVFNDAKVIPARFALRKNTGGRVEGLFLREIAPGRWRVLLRNAGSPGVMQFADDPTIRVDVISSIGEGEFEIEVGSGESSGVLLGRLGRMPLPPYIKREKDHDQRDIADRESYQTVYAKTSGSVAAPTAGLHFTEELLRDLDSRGIERCSLTLHVGMGTFKPVAVDSLEHHNMHSEKYEIDATAAAQLNRAQKEKRRIVAVGTTSARVLESYPDRPWEPAIGETSIFIYPPYQWKRVGALLTNFHLPRSTLVALVAAMVGLDQQRRIYQTAIENRYRFFSFGDAMFIDG
jgi:S-adenosylmethionine:tRNA ribosyltransferase-isomerase